jgi:hypothetical protein
LVLAGALQCVVAVLFARPLLRSTSNEGAPEEPGGGGGSPVELPVRTQSAPSGLVDPE